MPDYPILPDLAPLPSRRRPGRPIETVKFLVAHDTGNPGASARAHARWYRSDPNPPLSLVSSAHLFVDDREIVETVPALTAPPEQALHVLYSVATDNALFGADANRAAIGVEYCYGGTIDADAAYDRYVFILARLCRSFGLDPATRITGHHVLDPQRKTDPVTGLAASGRSFDGLLADVALRFTAIGGNPALIGAQAVRVGPARATVNLNRRREPTGAADRTGRFRPGDAVTVTELVAGQRVMGTDRWCRLPEGDFCWSGGLVPD